MMFPVYCSRCGCLHEREESALWAFELTCFEEGFGDEDACDVEMYAAIGDFCRDMATCNMCPDCTAAAQALIAEWFDTFKKWFMKGADFDPSELLSE